MFDITKETNLAHALYHPKHHWNPVHISSNGGKMREGVWKPLSCFLYRLFTACLYENNAQWMQRWYVIQNTRHFSSRLQSILIHFKGNHREIVNLGKVTCQKFSDKRQSFQGAEEITSIRQCPSLAYETANLRTTAVDK